MQSSICRVSLFLALALGFACDQGAGTSAVVLGPREAVTFDARGALPASGASASSLLLTAQIGDTLGAALGGFGALAGVASPGGPQAASSSLSFTLPCRGSGIAEVTRNGDRFRLRLRDCMGVRPGDVPASGTITADITYASLDGLFISGDGRLDLTLRTGAQLTGSFSITVDFARRFTVYVDLGDGNDEDTLEMTMPDGRTVRLGCIDIEMMFEEAAGGLRLTRIAPFAVAARMNDAGDGEKVFTINDYANRNRFGDHINFRHADGLPWRGTLSMSSGDHSEDDGRTGTCRNFGTEGDGSYVLATFAPDGCVTIEGLDSESGAIEIESSWQQMLAGDYTGGGCNPDPQPPPPDEPPTLEEDSRLNQFVMATSPSAPGSTLEVRVSPDGTRWASPVHPLMLECNQPIEVHHNIGPGLASTPTHYLAAAYDVNGTLYFSKSRNGINWEPAQASIAVPLEDLAAGSRPSVVYDRETGIWYAVVATYGGGIVPYALSFLDLDGVGSALSQVPIDIRSKTGVHVTYTGVPNREYMLSATNGTPKRTGLDFYTEIPFPDGRSYGSNPGIGGSDPVPTIGAAAGSGTLQQIHVVTNNDRTESGGGDDDLTSGENTLWEYDAPRDEWTLLFSLREAGVSHEGAGVAGVSTDMIIASPGVQSTDVWFITTDERLGRPVVEYVEVKTGSIQSPAVAYGPAHGRRMMTPCCLADDPACDDADALRDLFMRFRSFKRVNPPDLGDFDAAEDVSLSASLHARSGAVSLELDADEDTPGVQEVVVLDATLNQSHLFNEGRPGESLPALDDALMQPGEWVTVTLTGSDGPSTVEISYEELVAPQGAGNAKQTRTLYADGQPAYQLIYDASTDPAQ